MAEAWARAAPAAIPAAIRNVRTMAAMEAPAIAAVAAPAMTTVPMPAATATAMATAITTAAAMTPTAVAATAMATTAALMPPKVRRDGARGERRHQYHRIHGSPLSDWNPRCSAILSQATWRTRWSSCRAVWRKSMVVPDASRINRRKWIMWRRIVDAFGITVPCTLRGVYAWLRYCQP